MKKDTESFGFKKNGRGFTKEKRFMSARMKDKDKIANPAPSHYNSHMFNTISSNFGTYSLHQRRANTKVSFDNKYKNKLYFKELERCNINQHSPGPGAYNYQDKVLKLSYMRNSHHNSFTKVKYFLKIPKKYFRISLN